MMGRTSEYANSAMVALLRTMERFSLTNSGLFGANTCMPVQVDGQSIPAYNALYVATMQDSSDALGQASRPPTDVSLAVV